MEEETDTMDKRDIGKRRGMRERRGGRTDAQLSVTLILFNWEFHHYYYKLSGF